MKAIYRIWIVALMIVLAACSWKEPEAVVLQLNWEANTSFLGYYVALAKGFYEQEGLDVTILTISQSQEVDSIPQQVLDGKVDYAIGVTDLRIAQREGAPLTALANIIKLAPGAFFARADIGIITPQDFAGHSVVVKNAGWQDLLENFLAQANLTLEDVEIYQGSFDMTPFFEGEVDVWAGFINDEVVLARLAGLDIVTFPLYEYGYRGGSGTIYATREKLDNDSDQVERFLRASLRGWQWAIENPAEAVDIMIELNPELASERDFHLASFSATIPLIIPPNAHLGEIDCEAWIEELSITELDSIEGSCTTNIFEAVS